MSSGTTIALATPSPITRSLTNGVASFVENREHAPVSLPAKNWQIQSLGNSSGSSAITQRIRATNAPDRFGFTFKDDFRSTQNIFPIALADLRIIWLLTDVSFQQRGKCTEQIRCLLHCLSLQVLRGSLSSCVLYQQDSAVECPVCVFPYATLLKCMFDRLHRRCVMLSSSSQSCPLTHPGMSLRLSTFHDLARLITVMAPHTRHVSLSLDTRLILYGQNWHTIFISFFLSISRRRSLFVLFFRIVAFVAVKTFPPDCSARTSPCIK